MSVEEVNQATRLNTREDFLYSLNRFFANKAVGLLSSDQVAVARDRLNAETNARGSKLSQESDKDMFSFEVTEMLTPGSVSAAIHGSFTVGDDAFETRGDTWGVNEKIKRTLVSNSSVQKWEINIPSSLVRQFGALKKLMLIISVSGFKGVKTYRRDNGEYWIEAIHTNPTKPDIGKDGSGVTLELGGSSARQIIEGRMQTGVK